MRENEELQQRQNRSRGGCLIFGSLLLAVMYVLSPPFALWIAASLPNPASESLMDVLEIVYYPLDEAYVNIEWVEDFYDWYLNLFGLL